MAYWMSIRIPVVLVLAITQLLCATARQVVQTGGFYGARLGRVVGSTKPSRRPYFEFYAAECSLDEAEERPHKNCKGGSTLHIYQHFTKSYTKHSTVSFTPKSFVAGDKGPRYFRSAISADHVGVEKYLSLTTFPDSERGWDVPVTWFVRPIDEKWTRPVIKKVETPGNASSWYGHSISVIPGDPDTGGVLVADKGRAFMRYYDNKANKVDMSDIVSPLPDNGSVIIEEFATSVTQPMGYLPLISQPGTRGGRGHVFSVEKRVIGHRVSFTVRELLMGPWYDASFGQRILGRWRTLVVSGSRYSGRKIVYVYRKMDTGSYKITSWKLKHKIDTVKDLKMTMRDPPVFDVSSDYIAISGYRGRPGTLSYREMVALYKLERNPASGDVRFVYQGKVKDPRYKDLRKNNLYKYTSNEFGYSVAVSSTGDVFVGSPHACSRRRGGIVESKGSVDLFLSKDFR